MDMRHGGHLLGEVVGKQPDKVMLVRLNNGIVCCWFLVQLKQFCLFWGRGTKIKTEITVTH